MDPNFPHGLNIHPSHGSLISIDDDLSQYSTVAQEHAIASYGIAGRVWEASYLLAQYLLASSDTDFDPPCPLSRRSRRNGFQLSILELGSGSGFVARIFTRVLRLPLGYAPPDMGFDKFVATDLANVCELLADNLAGTGAQVAALPWGDLAALEVVVNDEHFGGDDGLPLTHIVLCDLIYFPELLAPLLRTLIGLTNRFPSAELIIAYKLRSLTKEEPFWLALGIWFSLHRVQSRNVSDNEQELFLMLAQRKEHTLGWAVPPEDHALLQGLGLPSQDGADAFECMLFMSVET
ncbi:hypothetical protein BKA62DRAFT_686353 [Auriculariales sp. MPI-PUGE-AT-0066]|nr:hypothetical protein BKA62DRAFT_686353 [Auriculariales sp. MPI-PUGE-AT-0066]